VPYGFSSHCHTSLIKAYFNILLSLPCFSRWPLPFGFYNWQFCLHFCKLMHASYPISHVNQIACPSNMLGKDYKIMLNMSTLVMSTQHKHRINNSADQHNAPVCPSIFVIHFSYFSRWWKTMHNECTVVKVWPGFLSSCISNYWTKIFFQDENQLQSNQLNAVFNKPYLAGFYLSMWNTVGWIKLTYSLP